MIKNELLWEISSASILMTEFLVQNILGEPIIGLFKKSLVERYGPFNPILKQWVDFEFWMRIITNESFGFIKEPLHMFRVHTNSQTFRNKEKKDTVGVTMRDWIAILEIIKTDNHYDRLRRNLSLIGRPFGVLYDEKMLQYLRKIGYANFSQAFGKELVKKLPLSFIQYWRMRLGI